MVETLATQSQPPDRHFREDVVRPQDGDGAPRQRLRSAGLDVRVTFAPTLSVIRLRGDLDHSNVDVLDDAIETLVGRSRRGTFMIIDLEDLSSCDSVGRDVIDMAEARLSRAGKQLKLWDPRGHLR